MPSIAAVAAGQKATATIENAEITAINAIAANLMTPTSVAGTGVSLSGAKVVASASTAVSVNGCFTSAYSVYRVVINLTTSGAANIGMTLRVAGTDATTAYDRQSQRALSATNTVVQSLNQASWALDITTVTGRHVGEVELFDPFTAVGTTGKVEFGSTANPMTAADGAIYNAMILHRTATAYDGFTLTPSTGNVTGSIWVLGVV